MVDYDIYNYLQKIHALVEKQNNKIKILEQNYHTLKIELDILKEKPTTIEYKFDQLKVETLSGTLNIGITPNDKNEENLFIDGIDTNNINEEKYVIIINRVKERIDKFLYEDAKTLISEISKKNNLNLDNNYYQLIINDINKQIDQRINLYINKLNEEVLKKDENEIIDFIYKRIKKDIHEAIESFIRLIPRRE